MEPKKINRSNIKMNLMMCEGKYVGRDEIATVPTPKGTAS